MAVSQVEVSPEAVREDDGAGVHLHHHHHRDAASSPAPPEGKEDEDGPAGLSSGHSRPTKIAINPRDNRGKDAQLEVSPQRRPNATPPGPGASRGGKTMMLPTTGRSAGSHRRPRASNAFDVVSALQSPTYSTTSDTGGESGDDYDGGSGGDDDHRDLWKVKVAGGGFLESSSYHSQHDSDGDGEQQRSSSDGAARVLRRLKLNATDDDDDDDDDADAEDRDSSTATTKVTNFTFQKRIRRTGKSNSLSAAAYYRPVDSLARDGTGYNPALSPPSVAVKSAAPAACGRRSDRGRPKDGTRRKDYDDMSEPSDLSITIASIPSGVSSISYPPSVFEDAMDASNYIMSTSHNNKVMVKSPARSTARSPVRSPAKSPRRSPVRSPVRIPARSPHLQCRRDSHLRNQGSIIKTASESDDDSELKRMETVTHTFQRSDTTSKNSKFSAVPLSGIGVDVGLNGEGRERVHTPREAANASCSISSLIEMFGSITPQREDDGTSSRISPFNIVKNMLCSPEGLHNVGSTKNADRTKREKNEGPDYADDWSVGTDIRSHPGGRRTYNEDDESGGGSHARRKSYSHRRSSSYAHDNRGEHKYYGRGGPAAQGGGKMTAYGIDRRSRSSLPNGRNPSVGRKTTLQDKYDRSLTYGHYHREDLSYYASDAGAADGRYRHSSHYSRADDDRSDAASRSSEPFRDGSYPDRDSPFIRRSEGGGRDGQYEDDDTSYR